MRTSKEKPKIYDELHAKFGVKWEDGICITYGDTAFCKNELRDDLLVHEEVHVMQQKLLGPDIWWRTYIDDPKFRLNQEVEAYRAQVKFIRENPGNSTRHMRRHYISDRATELSSYVYGFLVTYKQALELIR